MAFIVSGGELVGFEVQDEILLRRPTGATHSFRLTPSAYSIIEGVSKKSRHSAGRSAWVSDAICYYAASTPVSVLAQMGPVIYPNMPVASPQELHAELVTLNARVEWWVRKYNEERDAHDRLKNNSFISRMRKLWRK